MAKSEEIKTEEKETIIDTKKMNLYEKIQEVSIEVMTVEKKLTVGVGKNAYKAVGDLEVTLAVKKAEKKFRLISIPIKQELISSETHKLNTQNGESLKFVDNIKMTVKFVDLDDVSQTLEVEAFGKGVDSGDKGFGKASTYARKYALLNAYKIATGEDPDSDKSDEINVPKTVSEKKVLVLNYLNLNNAALQGALKMYNVTDVMDLSEKQIEESYTMLKHKKLI